MRHLAMKMTASDYYYIELCKTFGVQAKTKKAELRQKNIKPKRLAGGCLLYRFPVKKKA
jgi:hypothetical protein